MQYERLQWPDLQPTTDTPFTNPADYKILFNDWPYALDPDIKHLVVWTKFTIEDHPETGELSQKAETLIEDFVARTFCLPNEEERGRNASLANEGVMKREDLIWFKNWARLRSVHALGMRCKVSTEFWLIRTEHFHIMLYKASEDFLQRITHGDKPMSERLSG